MKDNDVNTMILKRSRNIISYLLRIAVLVIIGFIVLYPLFFMLSNAFKTSDAIYDAAHEWLPTTLTYDNMKFVMESLNFFDSLKQTMVIQIISAIIEIGICAFIAYGFARFNFKGKGLATFFLITSLLIPIQMYSLSMSINYRNLGIFNTPFTYWLPSVLGVGIRSGFIIFIYQQFFVGLPHELEDAAYVDGAGPIRTFFSIALPSSGVVITTVSVLSVIWHWNEYYLAELCFLQESRPLSVMIGNFSLIMGRLGIGGNAPMFRPYACCACLLYIVLPLLFYMIVQRNFIKSIDRVGITG